MRLLAGLFAVVLVCGCRPTPNPIPSPNPDPKDPASPTVHDYAFGKEVVDGDLRIQIVEVRTGQFSGQHSGQFTPINLSMVVLSVKNTHAGRIAEWPGWQTKAQIVDEHGNKFGSVSLQGWSCLPRNNTLGDGWDGDTGHRINPGETYVNALYYECIPPTSKKAIITATHRGAILRFSGPATPER